MAAPQRLGLLYEGKAKQIYATTDDDLVWMHFKDDATAFNGVKKASIRDKGEVNAAISAHLLRRVEDAGIPTHLVEVVGPRDQLCHRLEIIPVEVVVRNIAAGSICRRLGLEEGTALSRPLIEFFYKSDELNDPLINDDHALMFGWAEAWELAYLRHAALRVNATLCEFWDGLDVTLVDFKLEFGRALGKGQTGRILLADEITPDGSRLWEKNTLRKLDKDVFRRDLGDLGDTYRDLFARIFGEAFHADSEA
ncbi:MAG: phosphoribosylaminoimidazolesuccinocarboxamide synthase [Deltaproteobacteria bacterium]|nr:MAG: phosphoribosylaminoimidazolesuccinocarboxamide synthase [Deltaproteobacteria bacterium]